MFNSDMSDCSVEFEGEGEDVVIVAAITNDERPVRLILLKIKHWGPIWHGFWAAMSLLELNNKI
jgi:hypothetical protein